MSHLELTIWMSRCCSRILTRVKMVTKSFGRRRICIRAWISREGKLSSSSPKTRNSRLMTHLQCSTHQLDSHRHWRRNLLCASTTWTQDPPFLRRPEARPTSSPRSQSHLARQQHRRLLDSQRSSRILIDDGRPRLSRDPRPRILHDSFQPDIARRRQQDSCHEAACLEQQWDRLRYYLQA
jgi:hypothetical protein